MIEYTRQLDLLNLERLKIPITIIGAGAVGSFTALALAKMGASDLTVFDPDTIAPHNLPNQFYRIEDLGKSKVIALHEIISDYAGIEIKAHPEKFITRALKGIVIVAVDSMDERKKIWHQVKRNIHVPLFIDTRMGAEVARIYAVNPLADAEGYDRSLYPSTEALREPCTRRAIIYTVLGLSAWVGQVVKKFLSHEPFPKEIVLDFHLGMIIPF